MFKHFFSYFFVYLKNRFSNVPSPPNTELIEGIEWMISNWKLNGWNHAEHHHFYEIWLAMHSLIEGGIKDSELNLLIGFTVWREEYSHLMTATKDVDKYQDWASTVQLATVHQLLVKYKNERRYLS